MALTQRLDLRQTQALVMRLSCSRRSSCCSSRTSSSNAFIETELEQNPLLERDDLDPDRRNGEAGPESGEPAGRAAPSRPQRAPR